MDCALPRVSDHLAGICRALEAEIPGSGVVDLLALVPKLGQLNI